MLLNSQDEAQPGGEGPDGIKFTLTYVDDPTVTFDVCGEENTIITDKKGAATTEKKEVYPRGTLIYGKWKVSQPSQEGIQEPIRDFVIEITEDGKTYPYTIHNALVQARVESRCWWKRPEPDSGGRCRNPDQGFCRKSSDHVESVNRKISGFL